MHKICDQIHVQVSGILAHRMLCLMHLHLSFLVVKKHFICLHSSFYAIMDHIVNKNQLTTDKVPHQKLISKLKSHVMGNSIINWIEQWPTDRRQRVVVDGEVSSWKTVLSGVPQGSVLWPILFLIYINDLEEGVTGKILKFADDTKLFRKVKEIGDKQNLQNDIDKLVKWSEKWQMLFNFGKCKCLHTGSGNTGMNYEMGGTILSKTVKEKDVGVTMNANMKVSEQCRIAAAKGNQVLGMIRRNITYKEKSLIIYLCIKQ